MRRWSCCCLLLYCLGPWAAVAAPDPGLVELFTFEEGLTGWWANPWGGGKAFAEAAPEAKFGAGALRARYEGVKDGANVIGPEFPADAPWRGGEYDRLVFWLKGDGSQDYVNVYLESGPGDTPLLFSSRVPLDSAKWRRFSLKFDTFWNREERPLELATLRRLMFAATGTHTVLVDGLALQRPLRELPLDPVDNPGPAAISPRLFTDQEGRCFFTFDPAEVLEETVTVELSVAWPGSRAERLLRTMPARAAREEAWLALPGLPGQDGPGRLHIKLTEPAGNVCYRGQFTFPVALPSQPLQPSSLQLVPQPKTLTFHPGEWRMPEKLEVRVVSPGEMAGPGARRLAEDLALWFGRDTKLVTQPLRAAPPAVVLVGAPGEPPLLPAEVRERVGELRPQGYVLHAYEEGLVLAAPDEAGMRYAAMTALQLLRQCAPLGGEVIVPSVTITDWPTLAQRAINIGLPTTRWGHPNDAPVPVDFFLDFLQRTVVDMKYNVVCVEILGGMKYDSHPELAGPAAYTKDEVRRIVEFLKGHGIEVIPIVESLGHADWLVIWNKQFREDGDTNTLCTRHPDIRHVLEEVYFEVLEVFRPRYFHLGLDEVRWQTLVVPPEQRCPRCQGVAKADLFIEHVQWLNDYCKSRGVRMLMWDDMLVPEHNGGAPFYLSRTLDKLPRDIIMCNWSTYLAPLSPWDFHRRGFTVWKSNSRGANALQLQWVEANMWGVWSRVPWLVEAGWSALEYSYLSMLMAAEYSWNPYTDGLADMVPLKPDYFAKRPLLQGVLAAEPAPDGDGRLRSLDPGDGEVTIAGITLKPFAAPVSAERSFAVKQPVAALYLLVAADLPAEQAGAFRELFKQKEHWYGITIGEVRMTYADGQTETRALRYGVHVRAVAEGEAYPHAFAALGQTPMEAGGRRRMVYLVQFPNPRPGQPPAEVRFVPGDRAAKPVLLGLAWQGVRSPASVR